MQETQVAPRNTAFGNILKFLEVQFSLILTYIHKTASIYIMYIFRGSAKYFISILQVLTCNAIEIQKQTIEFVLK